MPDYLTSKLKHDATGLPAARTEGWITGEFSTLGVLAENLDSAVDFHADVFIDAIPDIWGKSLVFGYALADADHSFHRSATGAFRGFLTMLALRLRLGHRISVVPVDINAAKAPRFTRIAGKRQPAGSVAPDLGWKPTFVFLLDDEVVGITSPLTIIAPREGNDLTCATAVGLADGYRFTDPTEQLHPQTAADVASWVRSLATRLVTDAGEPSFWQKVVAKALDTFVADLVKRCSGVDVPQLEPHPSSMGLTGAYSRFLGNCLPPRSVPSDVELCPSQGSADPRILVISRNTPDAWGVDPAGVQIWSGITHASIGDRYIGIDPSKIGTTALREAQWRAPEQLLLEQLTVVDIRGAFSDVQAIPGADGVAADKGYSPVAPITEELTKYLHPDYIARYSHFTLAGNGVAFSIALPVGTAGRTIEARRVYKFEDLRRVGHIDLPVCEIWPGNAIEGWKAWYAFCWTSSQQARYTIQPLGTTSRETVERRENRSLDVVVAATASAPLFLALRELEAVPGGDPKEVYRGLILPAYRSTTPTGLSSVAGIGFDFGTTSTEIYIKIGDGSPRPLSLSTVTSSITSSAERETRIGAMHRYFVPPGVPPEQGPHLSLLRRRRGSESVPVPKPVEQAHILFYRYSQNSRAQLDDPNLRAYLKWDEDSHASREAFLYQFAEMAALEALRGGARTIQFFYSYPTAFDRQQKKWVNEIWPKIVSGLRASLPEDCQLPEPKAKTESVAAAQYFSSASYGALTHVGSLVIDIGGGTSDVSIWREGKVCLQTSIRWSGREILLWALEFQKEDAAKLLFDQLGAPAEFREPFREMTGEAFFRYADAMLRSHGDTIVANLTHASGTESYLKLCSHISFCLGALLHYTGILLAAAGFDHVPRTFIGGNGSRVLRWLSPNGYNDNSPLHELFCEVINDGAEISEKENRRFPVTVSREPKCEAAAGLVMSMEHELLDPEVADHIVAGERFITNGEKKDDLNADMLSKGVDIDGLKELDSFMDRYNTFAAKPGQLLYGVSNVDAVLESALSEVRQYCLSMKGVDPNIITVKPLFILGLEAAIRKIHWGRPKNAAAA